jgi:hypothetical protein
VGHTVARTGHGDGCLFLHSVHTLARHAELTLRGTTLMLGPENPALGRRSVETTGASPASLVSCTHANLITASKMELVKFEFMPC